MHTYVALLRGINLGSRRQVAMPALRGWLGELGYTGVTTLLRSGNVVFGTTKSLATVGAELPARLAEGAGFPIDCVLRTGAELAEVVAADPFGAVATDPARYLVSFLDQPAVRPDLDPAGFAPELFHVGEREVYFWVPAGIRNSRVLAAFPDRPGVVATTRNWNTVAKLHALVSAQNQREHSQ